MMTTMPRAKVHEPYALWTSEREAQVLHDAMAAVDRAIETLRAAGDIDETQAPQVIPNRWDMPDRTIVLRSPSQPGLWNSVQLTLIPGDSPHIAVGFSAWMDREVGNTRLRHWCHSSEEVERTLRVDPGPRDRFSSLTIVATLRRALALVASCALELDWYEPEGLRGLNMPTWQGDHIVPERPVELPAT